MLLFQMYMLMTIFQNVYYIRINVPVEHHGLIISWPYMNMKMRIRR